MYCNTPLLNNTSKQQQQRVAFVSTSPGLCTNDLNGAQRPTKDGTKEPTGTHRRGTQKRENRERERENQNRKKNERKKRTVV